MDADDLKHGGNDLLAVTPAASLARMAPHCRRIALLRGAVISKADQPMASALFIESGVASIIKPSEQYGIAIGIAGSEGFLGTPLVLGGEHWPYSTVVQADQLTGITIGGSTFRRLVAEDADLRSVLLRSIQVKMVQLAEGLISIAQQRLLPRLARWLLMYRDRVGADQLAVTHKYMALMVGARRSAITAALHELEGAGLISSTRGLVTILEPDALLALAAGGYGVSESEHTRLIQDDSYI